MHGIRLAAAFAVAVLAGPALGQSLNYAQRHRESTGGIAIPDQTVAGAEEPGATGINPAGVGFIQDLSLRYFHEAGVSRDFTGDGVYLVDGFGGVSAGFAMEWIRPPDGDGPRYRKTGWSLALAGDQDFAFGATWNFFSSPDQNYENLSTVDLGVTARPLRWLSIGAAILDVNAKLGNERLPMRYNLGIASRLWHDRLTLNFDIYADDDARGSFVTNYASFGASVEVLHGLALHAQYLLPLSPVADDASYRWTGGFVKDPGLMVALSLNSGVFGLTAGAGKSFGSSGPVNDSWITGIRVSDQRYRELTVLKNRVPVIDVAGALSGGGGLFSARKDPFAHLLKDLRDVREDARTAAVVLKIDGLGLGAGRTEDLRAEIALLKAAGKPVYAYLGGGGTRDFYLAAACDRIWMPPSSSVAVNGVATTNLFLKDTLAKIGVTFESVHAGRYKNAPDQFTKNQMSDAQREVNDLLLDDGFGRLVKAIADGRKMPEAKVKELIDVGYFSTAEATAAGLVDGPAWPDELEEQVERAAGRKLSFAKRYGRPDPRAAERWGGKPVIAVITVDGAITGGKSRESPFMDGTSGSESITKQIRAAASDDEVKAILLRVDSPGGDALASDLIWRELMMAKKKGKPIVASMGDFAASGGYFVAVAADHIIAEPTTLTGSIGVFSLKPEVSGLLQKLAVNEVTQKRGKHADILTIQRPWTEDERELMQKQIDAFYDVFLTRVAEGRRMSKQDVDKIAGGHVWTGSQALERKLVDQLGSFSDALARQKGGIPEDEDVEVRQYHPDGGMFEGLGGGARAFLGLETPSEVTLLLKQMPELRALALLSQMGPVLALPEDWVTAGR
jgi:protease-4